MSSIELGRQLDKLYSRLVKKIDIVETVKQKRKTYAAPPGVDGDGEWVKHSYDIPDYEAELGTCCCCACTWGDSNHPQILVAAFRRRSDGKFFGEYGKPLNPS